MPEIGNLIHSTQAKTMLEIYSRVLDLIERAEQPYQRIFDLGCWAGCLSMTIATRFKNAHVIGIDQAGPMLLELQRRNRASKNLEFRCLNIEEAQIECHADLLVSVFGMDLCPSEIGKSTRSFIGEFGTLVLADWNIDTNFTPSSSTKWDKPITEIIEEMEKFGWQLCKKRSDFIDVTDDVGRYAAFLVFDSGDNRA